jgi:DnaK suppressor protein
MKPVTLDHKTLSQFKSLFQAERENLVFSHKLVNEEFNISKDDMLDEVDLTSFEQENTMRMRLRTREALYLKKIDQALARIEQGTFGQCESCEEAIESKRLLARPTTELCLSCKETAEHVEKNHADGHRSKSFGAKIRLAG